MASQPDHWKLTIRRQRCLPGRVPSKRLTPRRSNTKVQRWSVGRLVTNATTICSVYRKPFFLLEHESGRRHKSKRAPRCYTTLWNFTAPDIVPAFSPHSNVCSLASATIHAAFEKPRPPRPS